MTCTFVVAENCATTCKTLESSSTGNTGECRLTIGKQCETKNEPPEIDLGLIEISGDKIPPWCYFSPPQRSQTTLSDSAATRGSGDGRREREVISANL